MRIIFEVQYYIYEATSRLSQLLKLTQRQQSLFEKLTKCQVFYKRNEMDFVHFTSYEREVE